jgi:hypothetical protein
MTGVKTEARLDLALGSSRASVYCKVFRPLLHVALSLSGAFELEMHTRDAAFLQQSLRQALGIKSASAN